MQGDWARASADQEHANLALDTMLENTSDVAGRLRLRHYFGIQFDWPALPVAYVQRKLLESCCSRREFDGYAPALGPHPVHEPGQDQQHGSSGQNEYSHH